jgi:hypothetical protein
MSRRTPNPDRRRNLGSPVDWNEEARTAGPKPAAAHAPAFAAPPPAAGDGEPDASDDGPFSVEYLEDELVRVEADLTDQESLVWALNRDFGGLDQRLGELEHARGGGAGGLIGQRIRAALAAIGNVFRPPTADSPTAGAQPWPPGMPVPHPPLVPFGDGNLGKRIIAVTAFELSKEALAKVLDTVEAHCRKRDTLPLVLTDCNCFEMFRDRSMVFEYFPPEASRERFAPDLQWPLFFRRRLALLRRKWGPVGVVSFGAPGPIARFKEVLVGDE